MQFRIDLPQTDERPKAKGFRWCTKDCRWEKPCTRNLEAAQQLGYKLSMELQVTVTIAGRIKMKEPLTFIPITFQLSSEVKL